MIKTFVSYHHKNDQAYKEAFIEWAEASNLINNYSVGTGDIDPDLPNETIRRTIRDYYLRDSEVTVLLCGSETRFRKHVDWELKSSMIDGQVNKQSGILVIDLPTSNGNAWYASHSEHKVVYPEYGGSWYTLETKEQFKEKHPDIPRRILENLAKGDVNISIVPWGQVYGHHDRLKFLLERTALSGRVNPYDTSRKMRMRDYNPKTDDFDYRVFQGSRT